MIYCVFAYHLNFKLSTQFLKLTSKISVVLLLHLEEQKVNASKFPYIESENERYWKNYNNLKG